MAAEQSCRVRRAHHFRETASWSVFTVEVAEDTGEPSAEKGRGGTAKYAKYAKGDPETSSFRVVRLVRGCPRSCPQVIPPSESAKSAESVAPNEVFIRRVRRFPPIPHGPRVTSHVLGTADDPSLAFGPNQERLSLCRVPAESSETRRSCPLSPLVPHSAPNALSRQIKGSAGLWDVQTGFRRICLETLQERRIRAIFEGPLKRNRRSDPGSPWQSCRVCRAHHFRQTTPSGVFATEGTEKDGPERPQTVGGRGWGPTIRRQR